MTRDEKHRLRLGLAFISPWIGGFLILCVYPLVSTVFYSLCDYSVLSQPVFVGTTNYKDLLHGRDLLAGGLQHVLLRRVRHSAGLGGVPDPRHPVELRPAGQRDFPHGFLFCRRWSRSCVWRCSGSGCSTANWACSTPSCGLSTMRRTRCSARTRPRRTGWRKHATRSGASSSAASGALVRPS